MCPLRIILVFLSAALAGFFVLRGLNSTPNSEDEKVVNEESDSSNAVPLSSKVCTAIVKGFWTSVDMASGKYLWRNLVSSSSSSKEKVSGD